MPDFCSAPLHGEEILLLLDAQITFEISRKKTIDITLPWAMWLIELYIHKQFRTNANSQILYEKDIPKKMREPMCMESFYMQKRLLK
jgi:hypothetical protein